VKFAVNPSIEPDILQIGAEGTKIIIIDDFAADLDEVRADAVRVPAYQEDGRTAYPGLRAVLPDNYVQDVLAVLKPMLQESYAIPGDLEARSELAYYSLLTKQESELGVMQRLPHFDTTKKHYYAILHYINVGSFGGTGFFRHRPTGFERVTEDRRDIFLQSASAFMAVRGLPEPKYINSSTNHFELFSHVAYRPNRLVVYPGCMLHSGLVSANVDVCDDPAVGRLTANIFVDFN